MPPHDSPRTSDARTAAAVPEGDLAARYQGVRDLTEALAAPLGPEDQTVQTMDDVSPTKWHRAHVTWFFETFLLGPHLPGYQVHDEDYGYLFNSYYEAIGSRHPRPQRGLLTRPTAAQVGEYRAAVDTAMGALLAGDVGPEVAALVTLGLHHEQQHQELLLMDIKHVLGTNPLRPAYSLAMPEPAPEAEPVRWVEGTQGLAEVGHDGAGFAFDNESPRHPVLLHPHRLADRLVTNGEWRAFIDDGGYHRSELWLSDGWAAVQARGWEAPLYWEQVDGQWHEYTLAGRYPLDPGRPVVHVSHYEADAFARWAGARLPREEEWAVAVAAQDLVEPHFELDGPHPRPAGRGRRPAPAPGLRRGLAVELVGVPRLPGLHPGSRCGGRVQRQVHERPGGAAGFVLRHAPRPRPGHLPQLLPALGALGLLRRAAGDRRLTAHPTPPAPGGPVTPPPPDAPESPGAEPLADNVARTLDASPQRWLSPKWLYDDLGSVLFEAITHVPHYYPTSRERTILEARAAEVASLSGADTLVELGSGTSEKTRLLLDAFTATGQLRRFCPLDVSATTLAAAAEAIAAEHPDVEVVPVVGDFLHDLDRIPTGGTRLVAFLGGTIGNLTPTEQVRFVATMASCLAPGDGLLLGTDLVKDVDRLLTAYDDPIGVTAAFDRNVLQVLNRELGADFDLARWRHEARWDASQERIEMHLVSTEAQVVHVPGAGLELKVEEGESIQTEISSKFRVERLPALFEPAGFEVADIWTDPDGDLALTLALLPR